MILGVGTDVVQISRIERLFKIHKERFISRILSPEEIKLLQSTSDKQVNFLAKRYAAKEAISKAFGTGIGNILQFKNITITNNILGKPEVLIHNSKRIDISHFKVELSISDDYPIAIAFAIVIKI